MQEKQEEQEQASEQEPEQEPKQKPQQKPQQRVEFELHPQLAKDCWHLVHFPLCQALLMRDHRFPWIILVPRLPGLRELHDLPSYHVMNLFDEIEMVSTTLIESLDAQKINVAALGNQVPQLHVHVIGRRYDDVAWPGPVWNAGAVQDVDAEVVARYERAFGEGLGA